MTAMEKAVCVGQHRSLFGLQRTFTHVSFIMLFIMFSADVERPWARSTVER